jgi:hypothetical protein
MLCFALGRLQSAIRARGRGIVERAIRAAVILSARRLPAVLLLGGRSTRSATATTGRRAGCQGHDRDGVHREHWHGHVRLRRRRADGHKGHERHERCNPMGVSVPRAETVTMSVTVTVATVVGRSCRRTPPHERHDNRHRHGRRRARERIKTHERADQPSSATTTASSRSAIGD